MKHISGSLTELLAGAQSGFNYVVALYSFKIVWNNSFTVVIFVALNALVPANA